MLRRKQRRARETSGGNTSAGPVELRTSQRRLSLSPSLPRARRKIIEKKREQGRKEKRKKRKNPIGKWAASFFHLLFPPRRRITNSGAPASAPVASRVASRVLP